MEKENLVKFLKKKGRSKPAIERTLWALNEFEQFLAVSGRSVEGALGVNDLEEFIKFTSKHPKNLLYGLAYLFDFLGREDLKSTAMTMRSAMLDKDRKPMLLRDLMGVDPGLLARLAEKGIRDANHLLVISRDRAARQQLADDVGISYNEMLDLVKMADLSRLFSVKTTRTRLYLDSGFDTLDKLAAQNPEGLVDSLKKFVAETNFPGIAPLSKEALCTVETAKKMERWITYDEEDV